MIPELVDVCWSLRALKLTASSHLNRWPGSQKIQLHQTSIFRCELLVSGRVSIYLSAGKTLGTFSEVSFFVEQGSKDRFNPFVSRCYQGGPLLVITPINRP